MLDKVTFGGVLLSRAVVLDTSVQVDRCKMPLRAEAVRQCLEGFDHTIVTGIGLLEFKAVYLQTLVYIHGELARKGARLTRVRDRVIESMHQQSRLRAHVFNNVIRVFSRGVNPTEEADIELAERARLKLEDVIPRFYRWFREESADTYLNNQRVRCNRADEAPLKRDKRATFDPLLPHCRHGVNKTCTVETLVRENGGQVLERVKELDLDGEAHGQLVRASAQIENVINNRQMQMDWGHCRRIGDLLIGMEVQGIASHALSTNARDWRVVCHTCGIEFVHLVYESE